MLASTPCEEIIGVVALALPLAGLLACSPKGGGLSKETLLPLLQKEADSLKTDGEKVDPVLGVQSVWTIEGIDLKEQKGNETKPWLGIVRFHIVSRTKDFDGSTVNDESRKQFEYVWNTTLEKWVFQYKAGLPRTAPELRPSNSGRPEGALMRMIVVTAMGLAALAACSSRERPMNAAQLKEFGTRYTAAWCSQNPASVAAFYREHGSLKINDGAPSVGRAAITTAAQGFMTAFPDMVVTMEGTSLEGDHAVYRWTLPGQTPAPEARATPCASAGMRNGRSARRSDCGVQGALRCRRLRAPVEGRRRRNVRMRRLRDPETPEA